MQIHEQQAANMRTAAKLFSVPYAHLLRAEKRGEIRTYGTGEGRCAVVIFEDLRRFLRSHPTRPNKQEISP
jgi:hypothetical protein